MRHRMWQDLGSPDLLGGIRCLGLRQAAHVHGAQPGAVCVAVQGPGGRDQGAHGVGALRAAGAAQEAACMLPSRPCGPARQLRQSALM